MLGHFISENGIEVDRAKVGVIERLPPPISVKGVRSFHRHAGFYRRDSKTFQRLHTHCANYWRKNVNFVLMSHVLKHSVS